VVCGAEVDSVEVPQLASAAARERAINAWRWRWDIKLLFDRRARRSP
jgi:hypothetical protein